MIDSTSGESGATQKLAVDPGENRNALDLEHLVPGALWRGVYLVVEALPDITYGKLLSATHVQTAEKVVLRSFRVADKSRARAWSQLFEYKGTGLGPLVEVLEFEGRRIEVTGALEGKNLATCFAGKPADEKVARSILQQISSVLTAIHEKGVAHLNLKPETIFADFEGDVATVKIGGLEAAADISKPGLMSITVDPFYAPPEAVGLLQHQSGPALRAWDWWSVGRIVQELILGRHILGVMLDRDVSRRTPELLIRAERILREKEPSAPRSGGVEAMPSMSAEFGSLLRGLLSSSREARWGASEVQRWLRGETVKERYHLSAHERIFVWRDQAFPVAEAVEYFSEAEHWGEGVQNIFGPDTTGTLIAFIADDSAHRDVYRRIQDLVKLPDSSAFADIETSAGRDVLTGIALAALSDGRLPVQIRGSRIDKAFLAANLNLEAQPGGLSLVQALLEPTTIQQIGKMDTETSRFLAEFEHGSSAAVALAARHHWVSRADREPLSQMLAIALLEETELRGRFERLRDTFAVSRDEALDQLFKKEQPDRAELVVLAYVGERPEKFGFVTHEKWSEERYQHFRDKGETLASACTWLNLAKGLRSGPHLIGPWPFVVVVWIALGTPLALALPGQLTLGVVLALPIAACVGRKLLLATTRRELALRLPATTTLPPPSACEEESRRIMRLPEAPSATQLYRSLSEINKSIQALPTKTLRASVTSPASFRTLRLAALGSALIGLAGSCGFGYTVVKHPPSLPLLLASWLHPTDQATLDAKKAADAKRAEADAEERKANAKKRRKNENSDDSKISWSFRPSPNPQTVRISKVLEPSTDQNREAREEGEYLVRPYTAATIDSLVAVRVTTETGVGLMLYDGKTAKIADKRLFVVSYVPLPRSWILLGERRAIFLDEN